MIQLAFKSDATSSIANGGTTTEDTVVFGATLNSSSSDQLRLEVEYTTTTFSGIANATSAPVSPNTFATATATNIRNGSYKWRARAVDTSTTVVSAWQEFSTSSNVNFIVDNLGQDAAGLAKQLVNSSNASDLYLTGGKGWDYNLSEFVSPNLVTSSYVYWNQDIHATSTGMGVDCSGLVMWAFDRSVASQTPFWNNFVKYEGANAQYTSNTVSIAESQLKPGDAMFFDNVDVNGNPGQDGHIDHVEMYVGESGGYDIVSAARKDLGIITRSKNLREATSTGFLGPNLGFRRIISASSYGFLASAHSPIDLAVTDPDGFTITPTTVTSSSEEFLREIPGVLYYSEMEKGSDGHPIKRVYSPTLKAGEYTIKVSSSSGVLATSTYTLDVVINGQTIILASSTPVSQIPSQGYGITASTTGAASSFIPVVIDIKPGSSPNNINLGSNGVVPTAIFGSATFDVHNINATSTTLANATIKLKGNGQPQVSYSDVNGDGYTDITMNFLTDALELVASDTKAQVDGFLANGNEFKGSDSV